MRLPLLLVAFCMTASGAGYTADAVGPPPPGQYRIDSETVTTNSSVAGTLTRTQHIDGATGQTTVTDKAPDGATATRTLRGDGPYGWCMRGDGEPPSMPPGACSNSRYRANPEGFNLSSDCHGVRAVEQWRRIDEHTWERVMHASYSNIAMSSSSPMQALTMAGMSPQDRAKVEASLPKQADIDAAMAPVIAQLEEQVRTGKPEEAALARRQLDALKGSASPSDITRIDLRERWTRIAGACAPKG